jgi:hypothetical protein
MKTKSVSKNSPFDQRLAGLKESKKPIEEIVTVLNREGYRTPFGKTITPSFVHNYLWSKRRKEGGLPLRKRKKFTITGAEIDPVVENILSVKEIPAHTAVSLLRKHYQISIEQLAVNSTK